MDSKQLSGMFFINTFITHSKYIYKGFGHYLSGIDPQHRSWRWHCLSTVYLCRIHFFRSVDRVCSTNIEDQSRLKSLLTAQSKEDYEDICGAIIGKLFITCSYYVLNIFRTWYTKNGILG
jgi:hypothetical protein